MDSDWIYDPDRGIYFHPPSSTYALPGKDGWALVPASQIAADSGWGALMEQDSGPPPLRLLRLVVLQSDILKPGSVAVIDSREGGIQLGRDRAIDRLRLKEMQVSKTHATIYYGQGGEWDDAWFIVDAGSTHGTLFNGERLSDSKKASKPRRLNHDTRLRIGSTVFSAHIHDDWPCNECQLSNDNEIRLDGGPERLKPVTHRPTSQPMAQLRARLLAGHEALKPNNAYLDRSAMRRARKSVSPPPAYGAKILSSHGWTPGRGLGKDGQGRAEPIQVEQRAQRLGLGESENWKDKAKQRRYKEY